MKTLRLTVAKNAASNLIRGGATAAVAIALPHFLTRCLTAERFAAWSLILQIAAYASFLDFGLQTAVARFLAQAIELEQSDRQDKLISTALGLLSVAAFMAFALSLIVIWKLPHLFGGITADLLPEIRRAGILLSMSACLLLPLSTYTGVLIGLQRNEIPAAIIGCSRIAGAVAAIIAVRHTQSLTILAVCIGVPNVAGGLIQMAVVQRLLTNASIHIRHASGVISQELFNYCTGLTVWSFAMLLIGGLDVTIVGHFEFSAVGYYSVAALLITFFAGLSTAVLSALMTPVAALHARGDVLRIVQVVFAATRLTMFANLVLTSIIFLWGPSLLRLWVGPVYAAHAMPILKILAVAQTIRLTAAPYSGMLVSIGEQGKGIAGAICEALLNLFASVVGAILFGPVGVAWGTLIGAIGGLLWTLLRVMPAITGFQMKTLAFLKYAVLPGCIPCAPFLIFWLMQTRLTPLAYASGLALCIAAALLLGRRYDLFSLKGVPHAEGHSV
jgi:O-antigen/teichoic acid export membrane protein